MALTQESQKITLAFDPEGSDTDCTGGPIGMSVLAVDSGRRLNVKLAYSGDEGSCDGCDNGPGGGR